MGDRLSRLVHNASLNHNNDLRCFTSLWMGNDTPNVVRLPSCLDELLDWSERAAVLTEILYNSKRVRDGNATNVDDSCAERVCTPKKEDLIRFVPYALADSSNDIENISSMSWIERASFYTENVVVAIELDQASPQLNSSCRGHATSRDFFALMTVSQLSRCYELVVQWSALMDLMQVQKQKDKGITLTLDDDSNKKDVKECMICLSESEARVLPCFHTICETCERRWVKKRLSCPFCRHRFSNFKKIHQSGWQLEEWKQTDVEKDIKNIEDEVNELWDKVANPSSTKETKKTTLCSSQKKDIQMLLTDEYVPVRAKYRRVLQTHDLDGFVVIN